MDDRNIVTMGKPPRTIIVVRHGARLDAADKQWHLTSPTPYDPPLTYGGWNQSRALGVRIGNLLQHIELHGCLPPQASSSSPERTSDSAHPGRPSQPLESVQGRETRKHRIIIHSSPYLRCVQTAISLSAGISQSKRSSAAQSPHQRTPSSTSPSTNPRRWHSSPHVTQRHGSPQLTPIQEPRDDSARDEPVEINSRPQADEKQCLLRLDSCLGEWLTPDYFDQITPPPGSVMMLAGAKANLLRQETSVYPNVAAQRSARGHFPGGWNGFVSNNATPDTTTDENAPPASNTDQENRQDSQDQPTSPTQLPKLSTSSRPVADTEYIPPTPTYAISSSDSIPAGFVAHARDACVDVDYQWDSMRAPLEWGDSGEYGEEWSSMHRRFRTGLEKMVNFYRNGDFRKTKRRLSQRDESQLVSNDATDTSEDDDTDTALIIVTHGAGCNAIIGALTNRPALLDVGMASLTLAVHKDSIEGESSPASLPPITSRRPGTYEICDEYQVKLVNSTEHLRVAKSSPAQSPPPRVVPSSMLSYRHRFTSLSIVSDSPETTFSIGPSARSASSHGVSRESSGPSRSYSSGDRHIVSGLWGFDPAGEPAEDTIPNSESSDGVPAEHIDGTSNPPNKENKAPDETPQRAKSQHGLWSPRARDPPSKRRWTVTERGI